MYFHYGGAEAGRIRVPATGPQEWVLEPIFSIRRAER